MPTLSAPGIGSNLDVNGIVSQLMEIERRPLVQLQTREQSFQAKLSAYGRIKSALASLQDVLKNLATVNKLSVHKASVADTAVASASATTSAIPGSYTLEVETLAQQHKLYSAAVANSTTAVGSGTLTIEFGTYDGGGNTFTLNAAKSAQNITIAPGGNTLAGIRDAINAANAGVSATIVQDGSSARIVVTSNDSGAANSLRIAVTDDDGNNTDATGLSVLAYDPTAVVGAGKNLTQSAVAQDAVFRIDGIRLTKPSNTVVGVIDGITLTLLKTNQGSPTALTVSNDKDAVKATIENFVKAYNEANKTLRELTAFNEGTKTGAVLQGDSTARNIQNKMRALITAPVSGVSGLNTLSQIGIAMQRDGSLAIDASKLQNALDGNFNDIAPLFAKIESTGSLGYAHQLEELIDGFLDIEGPIATRTEGINESLRDIADRRDALNRRLEGVEVRLRTQFTQLDTLISSLQKTSDFLTQQLRNLNNGE